MRSEPDVQLAEHAGRTTSVLRTLEPEASALLRIAVVRHGRSLEERVFRAPARVRADDALLFEARRDGIWLKLGAFAGQLSHGGRITSFDELREQGITRLAIELGARGRVVVGSTTWLFQVVRPPAATPKARLPARVLAREPLLDFPTTLIAALAFLLHFMAIGALYSDWADPVIADEISIAAVVDAARMPPAPPLESAPAALATSTTSTTSKQQSERGPSGTRGGQRSTASVRSAELESILLGILPALGGEGPASSEVLRSSEVPTAGLDAAAASERGVSGPGALVLGPSGQPLRPGESGNLRSIGRIGRQHADDRGRAVAVRAPKANTDVNEPTTTGRIDDAARVVAGLRAGFRQCYVRELDRHPDAQGSIRLTLQVGPNGEVSGVQAAASGNLSSLLVSCVQARAGAAQFSAPQGGSAAVVVPVIFRNQH